MVRWCSGYHARLSRERSRVQVPYEPPCGFIAQLAEHKTENLGVVGSIPTEATIIKYNLRRDAPIAQLDRAFDYGSKGWGFDSSWAHQNREVAQFGRAFGLGPRGCRFKSCLPDHEKNYHT